MWWRKKAEVPTTKVKVTAGGRPQIHIASDVVFQNTTGQLRLLDNGQIVAVYQGGHWESVQTVRDSETPCAE